MVRICVIGAGVVGMSAAVQIAEKLKEIVEVTVIAENFTPNTTGDGSAGLWGPYYIGETSEEKINKWSKATHDFLHDLWKKGLAAETGICMISNYNLIRDTGGYPDPSWKDVPFGYMKLSKNHIKKLSEEHGKNYSGGFHCITFTSEPVKLLPYLQQRFLSAGGKLRTQKINSLDELSNYDIIINCTGLGSLQLTNDSEMHPIRGQIIRVKAPWIFEAFSDDSDEGNYIIPNYNTVVLGGTHQMNDFNLNVSPEDKKYIETGCQKILPGLQHVQILYDFVGLRPGRSEVRMEIENNTKDNKNISIIHCTGHGGCGVTLCWGCGTEILENVTEILRTVNFKSKL